MASSAVTVFALSLAAFSTAATVLAQPPPPNVKLNTDGTSFLQNEEQVWINLTNPLNVIADWRDWRLGYRRVGLAVSNDGGASWGPDSLLIGSYTHQSDPCLTGDRTGNFYMNVLDYIPDAESQISVFRSTDWGLTWSGPVATGPVGAYFEDKQLTTVDRTTGPFAGNYYVSWTRYPWADNTVIMFVRSTDGAQSFDTSLVVGPAVDSPCGWTADAGQGSMPVVNSDGSVHVFWSGTEIVPIFGCLLEDVTHPIRHAFSVDGGATFSQDLIAFPSNAYFEGVDGGVDAYGFPIADADISGGPYNGTLYIAHMQFVTDTGGETDIQLRKSTDNGLTWSSPVVVNDDPPGHNIDQFHPWLTVDQDGVVVMIFYDQRNDPLNHRMFDCYFAASFDGAETFTHNYRLSEVSIDPNLLALASARQAVPGRPSTEVDPALPLSPQAGAIAEYIGVHASRNQVVAVWTDTRDGNQDVYSARFTLPFMLPRLYLPPDGEDLPDTAVSFRWSTCWHEKEDSYRLEIAPDTGFGTFVASYSGLTDNNFAQGAPLPAGDYYWRVKAFRSTGDSSGYSEIFEFTTCSSPGAPPTLVSPSMGDTVTGPVVSLDWSEVTDAFEYEVQLSAESDFSTLLVDQTLPAPGYTAGGLNGEGATYYWRVNSTNSCGVGDWSQSQFVRCPVERTGDADLSGALTSADIIYLVNYAFKGGAAPLPIEPAGDVTCDGATTSADIIYLVNHVFKGGPEPCDVCAFLYG